jgi:hypothetical protein
MSKIDLGDGRLSSEWSQGHCFALAAQRNFRVDCRKIMMSERQQNTLPETKLSGSKSTEILFERQCHVRAFYLSTAPGVRQPTRAKSMICMSGSRTEYGYTGRT